MALAQLVRHLWDGNQKYLLPFMPNTDCLQKCWVFSGSCMLSFFFMSLFGVLIVDFRGLKD